MVMATQNMKTYENITINRRKLKLNFMREIVKNILFRSPLFEGVES